MPYAGAAQHGGITRRNHRQRDFPARYRRGTSRTGALSPEAPFHAGRFEPAAVRRPFDASGRCVASYTVTTMISRLAQGAFPYVAGAKQLAVLDGTVSAEEIGSLVARMRTATPQA